MGAAKNEYIRLGFDRRLALEFHGAKISSDAGLAQPELYEFLESEDYDYASRLPGNDVLQREIEPILIRPVGGPSNAPLVRYADFSFKRRVGTETGGWSPRSSGTKASCFLWSASS